MYHLFKTTTSSLNPHKLLGSELDSWLEYNHLRTREMIQTRVSRDWSSHATVRP